MSTGTAMVRENQAIYVGPYKQKHMSIYNDDHVQERLGEKSELITSIIKIDPHAVSTTRHLLNNAGIQ